MTVLGYHIEPGGARALAWADSQVFLGDQKLRHECKLIVNGHACLVGAGGGNAGLLDRADERTSHADCIDRLVADLPLTLRRDLAKQTHAFATDFLSNVYVIVGFSSRFRRITGYVLTAANYFVPEVRACFVAPAVEAASVYPEQATDVVCIAHMQMAELRASGLPADEGRLTIATITSDGIRVGGTSAFNPSPRPGNDGP